MEWFNEVETFWTSEAGINFYRNLNVLVFLIGVPFCLLLTLLIFQTSKKYQARKKELKNLLNTPDMEDIRWFLKQPLSEHGIDVPGSAQNKGKPENGNGN